MHDIHFLRPYYLYLFIPFALLLLMFFRSLRRANCWNNICSKDLIPYIIIKKTKRQFLFYALTSSILSLLIIGLAGPAWDEVANPIFKRQSGLVIILDLSDSMNAEDIKPSRLKRAIYKLNDLLELRKDGQTALIVFSGHSFVVTPLTDDITTIRAQLPALEAKIMPSKGHIVHQAVQKAANLLKQTGVVDGSILLVTSELRQKDMEKTMEIVKNQGIKIAVLGIGTEGATPISNPDGGFLKDKNGSLMMTALSVKNLEKLAKSTNSTYVTITLDDSDIHQLAKEFSDGNFGSNSDQTYFGLKKWKDQGYLAVLIALPFVSLIFRKGILIVILFLIPQFVEASIWTDYFQTADARAESLYISQDYTQAKDVFENTDWKGCAHYQLEEYEEAAKNFQLNKSAEGLYNYGTSRAKIGDFEEALKAYTEVLEIEPNHEDALYNKKIIEDFKKNEEQKQNSNQEKNNPEDKGENQDGDQKVDDKEDSESDKKNQDQDKTKEELGDEVGDKKENKTEADPKSETTDENKKADEKENKELNDQYKDQVEKEISQNENENEKTAEEHLDENHDLSDEDLQRQIDDRFLQRVKDDPGGLLRRKFLQQYRQEYNRPNR